MGAKLTYARLLILSSAQGSLGIISQPYLTGFERVSWRKNALWLCDQGLMEANAHGDFYITEAGRAIDLSELNLPVEPSPTTPHEKS